MQRGGRTADVRVRWVVLAIAGLVSYVQAVEAGVIVDLDNEDLFQGDKHFVFDQGGEGWIAENELGLGGTGTAFVAKNNDNFNFLPLLPSNFLQPIPADYLCLPGGEEIAGFNCAFSVLNFDAQKPIDWVFRVENSDGTTEYQFIETASNNSKVWTDFHLELGFGTGDQFLLFDSPGDGLDFDTPQGDPTPYLYKTLDPFASVLNHTPQAIQWSGFSFTPSFDHSLGFVYSLDVPDRSAIPEFAWSGDGYLFTLRHYPTPLDSSPVVPEPASVGLFGLGMLGIVRRAARRRTKG